MGIFLILNGKQDILSYSGIGLDSISSTESPFSVSKAPPASKVTLRELSSHTLKSLLHITYLPIYLPTFQTTENYSRPWETDSAVYSHFPNKGFFTQITIIKEWFYFTLIIVQLSHCDIHSVKRQILIYLLWGLIPTVSRSISIKPHLLIWQSR